MENIITFIESRDFINTLIITLFLICVYFIIKKAIRKYIEKTKNNPRLSKKRNTYMKLFSSMSKYLIILAIIILILDLVGFNVTSLLAGLGVASAIAGLAFQDALKDIIMGFNIVFDDYFSVGDVIKINGIEGKVLELGFKAVTIQDINNKNIYVVSNREIKSATRLSKQVDIDIPLPYEEKIENIEKIIEEIKNKISDIKNVEKVEYKGIANFDDSAIKYTVRIYGNPENLPQVKRQSRVEIKKILEKHNISIPYMQVDIHNKK